MKITWTWAVLAGLSALLVAGAASFDRSSWPTFVGDEATYAMQAESLAFDLDLIYTPADYERFVARWGRPPHGLILQSGDGGATITYGKPLFYAVYAAPFVRLMPRRGAFVANALLLAAAAFAAAGALRRRVGPAAPLWVAALVFASVSFAYAFWIHADLFLMSTTALALALAVAAPEAGHAADASNRRGELWRWAMVGFLLAVVVFSRPLYLPLFLPALAVLPRPRLRPLLALAAAALLLVVASASVHRALAGSWTGYGATRSGFYKHTGYPGVDFPASEWGEHIRKLGNAAVQTPEQMLGAKRVSAPLWAWNGLYFLAGENVGLVPYFLPALLGLAAWPAARRDRRLWWSLLAAIVLATAAFFLLRPFNFYGGGGALANRYFLPLYPALWFLPGRLRPAPILAAAAAAAIFLWPLWLAPRGYPLTAEGTYRYVSPAARALLPFETTQSHLKLAGREDLYPGFYLRPISPGLRTSKDGSLRLSGESARLIAGGIEPLAAIDLEVRGGGRVELARGRLERLGETAAARRYRLHLGAADARHPMWWTWERAHLYRLELRVEGAGDERPVELRLALPTPTAAAAADPR